MGNIKFYFCEILGGISGHPTPLYEILLILLLILLECNVNEWTAASITVWGTINNVIEEQGIVKK